jgi:cell division protein FtsQ
MNSAATLAPTLPVDIRWMNGLANALFALVGALLLAALLLWLARLPLFAIRAIRVDGDVTRNSVSTIRANAAPKLAGTFFTIDLEKARAAFESVPWVSRAVVHRVWPGTLEVTLQEHHPAALWQQPDSDDDELVDSEGAVFDANLGDVEDDGLPTFSGPDGSAPQMLAMYRQLQPLFAPRLGAIDTLALSGRGSWRVDLDKGAVIELGRGSADEVLARTDRFLRTLPQVLAHFQRPLQTVDLRHQDGYAVKLQGVTTLPDAPPGAKKRAAPAKKTPTRSSSAKARH